MLAALLARGRVLVRRDLTLGRLASTLAAVHGGRTMALDGDDGTRWSFASAADAVTRWSGAVARHASPGDRVVLAVPNGYRAWLACLAVARAGALPVPVNAGMQPEEIDHVTADAAAAWVVRDHASLEAGGPPPPEPTAAPDDVAALFYTSGTTGRPKGVQLTHRGLLGQMAAGVAWPVALRQDEVVAALPIAHIMGFVTAAGAAVCGVRVVWFGRFRPEAVLDAIEQRRSTAVVGVPAMYRALLEAGAEQRDLRSVRVWLSGADVLPPEVAGRVARLGAGVELPLIGALGRATVVEGYGMVELGGGALVRVVPPIGPAGGGSLGLPLPGHAVRVTDDEGRPVRDGEVGALWVRGPGVLTGYHGDPEATAAVRTDDGWVRTGDLAVRSPLGTVRFAGRAKDVITTGGYTVYALEVQRVLEDHPAVREAAVVAKPDDRLGEVPVAAVRVEGDVDAETIRAWAADRLARYKAPRAVVVVDELPRTGTHKVRRADVLALFP